MGARFDRFRVATDASLRARYGRTLLGYAWLAIGPVALVATLVVALSRLLGDARGALALVLGLLLWNFFAAGTSEGLRGLGARKGLVAAAGGAAGGVIGAALVVHGLELALGLATFLVCQVALGVAPAPAALAALVPLVELVLFTYGVALVVASLEARLGDVEHAWKLALAVGFWVTPIVYSVKDVPEPHRRWLAWNPVGRLVEAAREPILHAQVPELPVQLVTAVVVAVTCALGVWAFRRSLPLILERL